MTQSEHLRPANRLIHESSPYLLQHAHNPVDWYPWSPEAFNLARQQDKPVFLSVGYSACHWCHVMERESFENPNIAALMNEHFINIKVDREERPDVDQVYMSAVQALSGHGGWPMSVFLTPDGHPFFAGTYYPPEDRRGMPGFPRVLHAVSDAWRNRRAEVLSGARRVGLELRSLNTLRAEPGDLGVDLLDRAFKSLEHLFDERHGGFGDAPKFPHPMDLRVLLRQYHRTGNPEALRMARLTLEKMALGGIYDHLGGGFARYSTDARWLVPHFEKMLYDNALLASTYLEAYQLTHDPFFEQVARQTLDYVLGRMTDAEGGVYSTEDADSEGVEGKYYVWSFEEVMSLLGPQRGERFAKVYDVTPGGNWEHKSILNLPRPIEESATMLGRAANDLAAELAESRRLLLAERERRVPPGKDTKVIVAWNGMMIAAWAVAGHTLRDDRYIQAARRCAAFILDRMLTPDGRLWHTYKDGRASVHAFLDDYSCFIDGLTRLFEATGESRWLHAALQLAEVVLREFRDAEGGGFFYTGVHSEALIVRTKDAMDNATPSGNAMAATAMLRLAALTGRAELEDAAVETLRAARALLVHAPTAAGQSLIALDFLLGARREIVVIAGADDSEFCSVQQAIAHRFEPYAVIAPRPREGGVSDLPLFEGRGAIDERSTVYVCEAQACAAPLVGLEAIERAFR